MKPNKSKLSGPILASVVFLACGDAFSQSTASPGWWHTANPHYGGNTPASARGKNGTSASPSSQGNLPRLDGSPASYNAVINQIRDNTRQMSQNIQDNSKAAADAFNKGLNGNSANQPQDYSPSTGGSRQSNPSTPGGSPLPGKTTSTTTTAYPNSGQNAQANNSQLDEPKRLEQLRAAGIIDAQGAKGGLNADIWASDFEDSSSPQWINYNPQAVLQDPKASLGQKQKAKNYLAEQERGKLPNVVRLGDGEDRFHLEPFGPPQDSEIKLSRDIPDFDPKKGDAKPITNQELNRRFQDAEKAKQAADVRIKWLQDANRRLSDTNKSSK